MFTLTHNSFVLNPLPAPPLSFETLHVTDVLVAIVELQKVLRVKIEKNVHARVARQGFGRTRERIQRKSSVAFIPRLGNIDGYTPQEVIIEQRPYYGWKAILSNSSISQNKGKIRERIFFAQIFRRSKL